METLTDNPVTAPPAVRPASQRQRAASRRNGAKSRGPVTPEGKARVSQNGIKHGLSTQTPISPDLLLQGESRDRFLQLNAGALQHFAPVSVVELGVAESWVMARWRQGRTWDLEAITLQREIDSQVAAAPQGIELPLAAAQAWAALAERSRGFRLMHRYETRHSHDMSRALRDFERLQKRLLPTKPDAA